MFSDAPEGGSSISRWSTAINNDFAARMIWSVSNNYTEANHFPIAVVNGNSTEQVLEINAKPGAKVDLSAVGSSDPDGNSLLYNWYFYKEGSTFSGSVTIQNYTTDKPTVSVPSTANGSDLHIILELRDSGSPTLYAYRRVIIHVAYDTGINDIKLDGTQSGFLMKYYPNPSSKITNIEVSLPADGDIKADIFSLDGKFVENICLGFLNKGTHILLWKPESSEKGIFICKLRYEDREYCNKIIRN
jgi:hypothetical protein